MNGLTELGRQGFLDGSIDWDTDTIKIGLLDPVATTDTAIKAITGATAATPIVVTCTAHGFANGDLVYIDNVGGNTAANGLWKIANQAANTFELTDPVLGTNVVGISAYTSGGYAVNYGPSTVSDMYDDVSACIVGTDQTLGTKTVVAGVADAADPSWSVVAGGNVVRLIVIYKDTGTPSTSRIIGYLTGKHIVTVAAAAAGSATSVAVDPLTNAIPNGAVLAFSNGRTATLTAGANAGDRTLTVSALANALAAGNRALAPITSSNFPLTTNGGPVGVTFDNGPYKIFKL